MAIMLLRQGTHQIVLSPLRGSDPQARRGLMEELTQRGNFFHKHGGSPRQATRAITGMMPGFREGCRLRRNLGLEFDEIKTANDIHAGRMTPLLQYFLAGDDVLILRFEEHLPYVSLGENVFAHRNLIYRMPQFRGQESAELLRSIPSRNRLLCP